MATVLTTTYDSTTATTALSITIVSLATSATLVTGRQSAVIDNSSNQFVDYQIMGQITTGTTPTAGTIALYAFSLLSRTASANVWPQAGATALVTTDAAATWDAEQLAGQPLVWSIANNTTSNRAYAINIKSVAALFGGTLPIGFGFYLAHSSVAALNATAGNHWLHGQGIKFTST